MSHRLIPDGKEEGKFRSSERRRLGHNDEALLTASVVLNNQICKLWYSLLTPQRASCLVRSAIDLAGGKLSETTFWWPAIDDWGYSWALEARTRYLAIAN